jgi:CII-binding regulator of phage lambda lysogenization HflD
MNKRKEKSPLATPTLDTSSSEGAAETTAIPLAKRASTGQALHYRVVLTLYRVFAIAVLYLVLFGILTYAFVMGFYAISNTWAAPLILSAADEKSLDFRQKLVTSQQTIEDLKVDSQKLENGIAEMKRHRAALLALEPQLQEAIARERMHNQAIGPQLAALDTQKQADNTKTQTVLKQLKEVESNINKDLAAGLITKGDAATQLSALNQAENAYTDSKIAEVLLTDSVLQKNTTGTDSLDVLEKQAELRSEAAQLDVAINVADKQLQEESRQIDRLREAIRTAKQSPYYLNAAGDKTLFFAFVPYDNQASAVAGRPVYDCYLNMFACRKVGTVNQVFAGEETAIHPIFKTNIRGFLMQMNLDHPESAKSKTVFLGRKPLLF